MIDRALWPVWVDGTGATVRRIRPVSGQRELGIESVPKATEQVVPDGDLPGIHEYIRLYNQQGSDGLFRVVSSSRKYGGVVTLQLLGVADTLTDDLYKVRAEEKQKKTASAWISDILSRQAHTRWTLGECDLTAEVELQPNYQTLWDLLEAVRTSKQGYYWVYNTDVWPWVLNLKALPQTVTCGFSLHRNIASIQTSISDADLINTLHVAMTANGETTVTTYEDAESQRIYGKRERTTEIKSDQLPEGMTEAQYAQAILDAHKNPVVAVQINGYDLHRLTGDDYDRIQLGTLCSVNAEGMTNLQERVVGLTRPDVYRDPGRVNFSLNTIIPPITGSLGAAQKMAQAVKGASRGGGGPSASGDIESWAKVLTKTIDAVDGTGIAQLWQSGIEMTAMGGTRIFSLCQGLEAADAELVVNRNAISAEVSRATAAEGTLSGRIAVNAGKVAIVVEEKDGQNVIKAASIVTAINDSGSEVAIAADKIKIKGTNITIGSVITTDASGAIVIAEGIAANEILTAKNAFLEHLYVGTTVGNSYEYTEHTKTFLTSVTVTFPAYTFTQEHLFGVFTQEGVYQRNYKGCLVTSPAAAGSVSSTEDTITYLGRTPAT